MLVRLNRRRMFLVSVSVGKVALALSFVFPAVIRWIPEAQFPYPIGFDTPMYLAMAKVYSRGGSFFPLLYRILGWLYILGVDPIVAMKALPTVLYGFLGLSAYCFARSCLGWDEKRSLIASCWLAVSPVSLRVSWDLNKQVFATVLLFFALSMVGRLRDVRGALVFVVLCILVASSHQLVFALMCGVLFFMLLSDVYRFLRGGKAVSRILLLFAALVVSVAVFLGLWYRWNLFAVYRGGVISYDVGESYAGEAWRAGLEAYTRILILGYALTLPLSVLGFFHQSVLTGWTITASVGSFSIYVLPSFSFRFPDRWMYLLVYPMAFYATNALGRLKLVERLNFKRALALLVLALVVNVQSLSLLGLYPRSVLPVKTPYFPERMTVSSIPVQDIEFTAQLLNDLSEQDEDAVLIVNINYLGWVRYYSDYRTIPWVPWSNPGTIGEALEVAKRVSSDGIYLLWYDDQDAIPLGFRKIFERGSMKLYEYVGD